MAKNNTQPVAPEAGATSVEIIGLEAAESMPIWFQGREYDLARLSPDEQAFLLQFPDQVPYLRLVPSSQIEPIQ